MGSGEVEVVLFVEVGSCVCCLFGKGYWMCVRSVKNRVKIVIYLLPCEGECPVGKRKERPPAFLRLCLRHPVHTWLMLELMLASLV